MSTESLGSPSQGASPQMNASDLPKGQCRFILVQSEIRGQRCACVNFSLKRSMPSAMCDCGHQACYHVRTDERQVDRHEMEQLKRRITVLEQQLDRETRGGIGGLVSRLSGFEEHMDKMREESKHEFQALYRHITQAWDSNRQLEARISGSLRSYDGRFESIGSEMARLSDRSLKLEGFNKILEGRLDGLLDQMAKIGGSEVRGRPRRKSTSDSVLPRSATFGDHSRRPSSASQSALEPPGTGESASLPFRPATNADGPWTVHISFLPDASQPFPFEKDTPAYKRCLSRGLHQVVVVSGPSAEEFTTAVSKAFGRLLKGRPWMPLQAKLCDARQLQGLPMLRPLDRNLRDCPYDVEFLRRHCAVCDAGGKIESLYIAMRADTLSWHFLRHSPRYIDGLEGSWKWHEVLDRNDTFDDDLSDEVGRPSAGDVTGQLALKRAASEMSRTSSFGAGMASSDGEGSRKIQRTSYIAGLVDVARRVEKV